MENAAAKLAHISRFKREKGSLGGVEKFALHLKRTFPELELFASDDAPEGNYKSDLAIAKALNRKLLEEGRLGSDSVVVCDGFWQAGLEGKVKALVNVAHGTYLGCAMANEFHRFGQTAHFLRLAKWQETAYRAADVVVAVSPLTQWELKAFYGLESVMIYNGVDLDVYRPDGEGQKLQRGGGSGKSGGNLILHAASPGRKQLEMVEATAAVLRRPIEHIAVRTGKEKDEAARWAQGAVAFFPSLYEGCAYSTLEAMACGLVPVSHKAGLLHGLPKWAGIEVTDHYPEVYAGAILHAMGNRKDFRPREWVERNASFDKFSSGWKKVIQGCH